MITILLSIVFLVLQGFGINVIQDWWALGLACCLEIPLEYFVGMFVLFVMEARK